MPTLNIHGIGPVKVDVSFLKLSPDDQQKTIDEIAARLNATAMMTRYKWEVLSVPPVVLYDVPSEPTIRTPTGAEIPSRVLIVWDDISLTAVGIRRVALDGAIEGDKEMTEPNPAAKGYRP